MNIFIQPAGATNEGSNYQRTIMKIGYNLDDLAKYIDAETYNFLKTTYGTRKIPIWGTKKGKRGTNLYYWEQMKKNDLVLFAASGRVIASAKVTGKVKNDELAKYLWNTDEDNNTWGLVYFLDEVIEQNVPYEIFNAIVGYKSNYKIQGFRLISQLATDRLLDLLDVLGDFYHVDSINYQTYANNLKKEEKLKNLDSLEKQVVTIQREEQKFLRQNLFNEKKTHPCSICGREIPIEFLWCSHIKKRSDCTLEEKLDAANIVTAMCKLGCDDLYEQGYLGVDQGTVVVIRKTNNQTIDQYLKEVEGKICLDYNENNKKYYEYHLKKFYYRKDDR